MDGLAISLGVGRRRKGGGASFSRSFTGGSLPSGVTLTRASTGRYINGSGVLTSAAIDVARFDYLVNGTYAAGTSALLIEPACTNLFNSSEVFDSGFWSKDGCTVTPDTIAGPDGLVTADTIVEGSLAGTHGLYQLPTVGAGTAYGSVWLKAGTRGFGFVEMMVDGAAKRYTIVVDLSSGAVTATSSSGTPTGTGYRVENWGGGWYRLIVWATHTTGTAGILTGISDAAVPTFNAAGDPTYTGNGTGSIYAVGAQVSLTDGSYTPSGVARSADAGADTIPAGVSSLRFTFDDASTQDVAVSPGAYAIPTNLNRSRIRGYVGS